jgi:hypothetical protein
MPNIIVIEREHVPVEQIAYIEPFEPPANGQFRPDKAYKGRVVLLNRETVLTEATPQEFAEANEFRWLSEDNVATNPMISFRVRSFAPTDDSNPGKPFQTRLMWRDPNGDSRSKPLLTKPELVIAIVLRGDTEPNGERKARPRRPAQARSSRKRATAAAAVKKGIAAAKLSQPASGCIQKRACEQRFGSLAWT